MSENFTQTWQIPEMLAALQGAGAIIVILLLIFAVRGIFKPNENETKETLRRLSQSQHELSGSLKQIADTQSRAHQQMIEYVEKRFDISQQQLNQSLGQTGAQTAKHLGELMQRLAAIDKAQDNIEKLSGDVIGLQDILSNKQTRGNFGEIQLAEIVANALPADSYTLQAVLSNNTRADCLIHLQHPPGPIVIDSKFPLEGYEALRNARDETQLRAAKTLFKSSIRKHIKDISQKYIIEGETADGAIMFLPSESVYAEIHANYPELAREGFSERVWIVSPTTCMATLTTMRAVMKDMRMREQATALRRELGVLVKDMKRLNDRVVKLDQHFGQAVQDIEAIKISTQKVTTRSTRLENLEFEEKESAPILPK